MYLKRSSFSIIPLRENPKLYAGFFVALMAVFFTVLLANAWVVEDAFITFRVIDNFVNGYGLRWNVDERVQVYTHPLWMLVHIPVYFLVGDIIYTTTFLCLVFSLLAFLYLAKRFYDHPLILFCCIFTPLVLSKAYVEYSVSGLENPLTHLLLVMFYVHFLNVKELSFLRLSVLAGFALLTRMDSLLLILPAFGYIFIYERKLINWKHLALGLAPLLIWMGFSLFYYGFFFPNTKYAKLNTGIPLMDYIYQSRFYFYDLFSRHLPTAVIMLLGLALAVKNGCQFYYNKKDKNAARYVVLGLGIVLYLSYIASIGGDFLSGRFWTPPFLLSVLLLAFIARDINKKRYHKIVPISLCTFIAIIFAVSLAMKEKRFLNPGKIEDNWRICTMRTWQCTFWDNIGIKGIYLHKWSQAGLRFRKGGEEHKKKELPGKYVWFRTMAGYLPYFSGPDVVIVDVLGIGDPLFSRLPINDMNTWHAGHYWRATPQGYVHARKYGKLNKMDPSLARYYEALHFITSGPLFDWERIKTIAAFNFGAYDHYLEEYVKAHPPRPKREN